MKCYCFTNKGSYAGGCALVVANSPIEAYGVLVLKNNFNSQRTDIEHCKEVENITPNSELKEPCIIFEHFYDESMI